MLLEAYRALINAGSRAGLSKKASDKVITEFNLWFYVEGDTVDAYLERIFDVMMLPKGLLLRHLAGEVVLKFLTGEADGLTTITAIMLLKEEHNKDEEGFYKKHGKYLK